MWIKQLDVDRFGEVQIFVQGDTWYEFIELLRANSLDSKKLCEELEADGFFWVDEDIVELIAYLNINGFRTIASCSGHRNRYGSPYVMFDGIIDLDKLEFISKIKSLEGGKAFKVMNFDGKNAIYLESPPSYYSKFRLLNIINEWCSKRIKMDQLAYDINNHKSCDLTALQGG